MVSPTGWAGAILITAMDIFGLPDWLKAAWQVIVGGKRDLKKEHRI